MSPVGFVGFLSQQGQKAHVAYKKPGRRLQERRHCVFY